MSLSIRNNLMAAGSTRILSKHYQQLATSTQRLASGLRINSGADDAAGLAIRELQRAEVASLNQGMRNAQDAVSLLQTADGALQIIDEKLIRMKELAEQAATGTYDSTQRMMLHNEFKAMAAEIDRIADATDFNGIKLLDGSLVGPHNGSKLDPTGELKVHFGTGNDCAEDYYYIGIPAMGSQHILVSDGIPTPDATKTITENFVSTLNWPGARIEGTTVIFEISKKNGGNGNNAWLKGFDLYNIPEGLKNVTIESKNSGYFYHKPHVAIFDRDGTQLTGYDPATSPTHWNGMSGAKIIASSPPGIFDPAAVYNYNGITKAGQTVNYNGMGITMQVSQDETSGQWEKMVVDKITDNLVFTIGGHDNNVCDIYDLRITADISDIITREITVEQLEKRLAPTIATQESAQRMLPAIDNAIVAKDNVRAGLGALQNRLENTITNLNIQAENLQVAESRISDTDVAQEMPKFIRNQVLSQVSTNMLTQANSLPRMFLQLITGGK